MQHRRFLLGDTVKYTGEAKRQSKKGNVWGTVVGYVKPPRDNYDNVFEAVVEFGDGSYIFKEADLETYHFSTSSNQEASSVDIVRITRKWDSE